MSATRWLAVVGGFAGVVLAARPAGGVGAMPALMAFCAACCWGLSVILARLINRSEPTTNQMIVSNALFALACAVALPFIWRTPDLFSLALMLGLGIAGGLGQFFLYEGFRFAPASAIAPIEYSGPRLGLPLRLPDLVGHSAGPGLHGRGAHRGEQPRARLV